jgi:hypothetical protein
MEGVQIVEGVEEGHHRIGSHHGDALAHWERRTMG